MGPPISGDISLQSWYHETPSAASTYQILTLATGYCSHSVCGYCLSSPNRCRPPIVFPTNGTTIATPPCGHVHLPGVSPIAMPSHARAPPMRRASPNTAAPHRRRSPFYWSEGLHAATYLLNRLPMMQSVPPLPPFSGSHPLTTTFEFSGAPASLISRPQHLKTLCLA